MSESEGDFCREHPFDTRCLKKVVREGNRVDFVVDADSPYFSEEAARCLGVNLAGKRSTRIVLETVERVEPEADDNEESD